VKDLTECFLKDEAQGVAGGSFVSGFSPQ
jgi:hypothetical protein